MAFKRPRRGISLGTIVMLSLSLLTLAVGGVIFLQISGEIGEIRLDPKMVSQPLVQTSHAILDTDGNAGTGGQDSPAEPTIAAPTQEPVATQAPTPPPSRSLTLTAVGQISLGAELRDSGRDEAAQAYSFDAIFAPIQQAIAGSDLSIATLRSGLSDGASDYGNYTAPSELAVALGTAGFNLLNLGTDRLLDSGIAGLETTRNILERLNLSSIGAYRNESERQALTIVEINGVKVGLLSYTDAVSAVGRGNAGDAQIGIAARILSAQAATNDISALRAQGADLIVVLVHWGSRTATRATREMQDLAAAMAEAGADVILGTNPTSVMEMERRTVTGADGASREVFIAYSLGNFLMDDSRQTADITGVVLRLNISWDAQSGKASFTEATYMPTWIMRYRDSTNVSRFRIVPAGTASLPENMTDSIFINMNKAYQTMVSQIGQTVATPVAEIK